MGEEHAYPGCRRLVLAPTAPAKSLSPLDIPTRGERLKPVRKQRHGVREVRGVERWERRIDSVTFQCAAPKVPQGDASGWLAHLPNHHGSLSAATICYRGRR